MRNKNKLICFYNEKTKLKLFNQKLKTQTNKIQLKKHFSIVYTANDDNKKTRLFSLKRTDLNKKKTQHQI